MLTREEGIYEEEFGEKISYLEADVQIFPGNVERTTLRLQKTMVEIIVLSDSPGW